MKTWKWLGVLGAVALVTFAIGTLTTSAFAQGNGPWGNGMRGGMMGGNGPVTGMHQWMPSTGARSVHTIVWNELSSALKLTPEELNAQLASGKTLAQIAEAQGVSQEQLSKSLEASVKAGLNKAVTDKLLTQEQADWMFSQMSGNWDWMLSHMGTGGMGFGPGGCHGNQVPQKQS